MYPQKKKLNIRLANKQNIILLKVIICIHKSLCNISAFLFVSLSFTFFRQTTKLYYTRSSFVSCRPKAV